MAFPFASFKKMIGSTVAPVTREITARFGSPAGTARMLPEPITQVPATRRGWFRIARPMPVPLPAAKAVPLVTTATGGILRRAFQRRMAVDRIAPPGVRPPRPAFGRNFNVFQRSNIMRQIEPLLKNYLAQGMPYYQAFNQARRDVESGGNGG